MGSGKQGNSSSQQQQQQTSTVGPSPQLQSELNQVWGMASPAAQNPFQQYGGQFVAPINPQQSTGIGGINNAAGIYSPYGQAANSALSPAQGSIQGGLAGGMGYTMAGAQPVGAAQINQYMSPYIQSVVNPTVAEQNYQNQVQSSALTGNAISAGAFGGDRAGVAQANLANTQQLAEAPVIAGLYNQGYNTALGAAQQQQQTELQAGNQLGNLGLAGGQAYGNLANTYAGLGTTGQNNALTAAQAQLGAGTLQQQTQQAQDTALYNQFLQEQAYPFQTSQFLSNIVQGTGPLYGSTTTSTGNATGQQQYPISFFRHGGRVHDVVMGDDGEYRVRKAGGGLAGGDDVLAALLGAQATFPYAAKGGLGGGSGPYGSSMSSGHSAVLPQGHAITFNFPSTPAKQNGLGTDIHNLNETAKFGETLGGAYSGGKELLLGAPETKDAHGTVTPATSGWFGTGGHWNNSTTANPAPAMGATNTSGQAPLNSQATWDAAWNALPADQNRGGRVGLAYGGIPYADDISDPVVPADIADPLSISQPQLEMAHLGMNGGSGLGGGGSQSSGLGSALTGLNGAFSLGKNIASGIGSIGSLFGGAGAAGAAAASSGPDIAGMAALLALRSGGRVHKTVGGGLEGDAPPPDPVGDLYDSIITKGERSPGHFDAKTGEPLRGAAGEVGISQILPSTAPEAAKMAGVAWNPDLFYQKRTGDADKDKTAEDYSRTLGKGYTKGMLDQFGHPMLAAAAYNAGPGAVQQAQVRAQLAGDSAIDHLSRPTQEYVGRVVGSAPPVQTGFNAPNAVVPTKGTAPTPDEDKKPDDPSWWDKKSGGLSGTERGIISLLSGLGGMASSNSRFLGSAIAQGLGAGAQTYGGLAQKGMGLDIQQKLADVSQQKVDVDKMGKGVELLKFMQGAYRPQYDTHGNIIGYIDGISGKTVSVAERDAALAAYAKSVLPAYMQPVRSTTPSAAPGPVVRAGAPTAPGSASGVAPVVAPVAPASTGAPSAAAPTGPPDFGDAKSLQTAIQAEQAEAAKTSGIPEVSDVHKQNAAKYQEALEKLQATAPLQRITENQKWLDEQASQAIARSQAREQLDTIRGVAEKFKSGAGADWKAQAQAIANSLNLKGLLPDTPTMNAAAYQTFMKAALNNAFANVKDMGGKPLVSEITGSMKATANPELQPEANREILSQLYARLDQADRYYGDMSKEMTGNKGLDRGPYTAQWLAKDENKQSTLADKNRNEIAVRGMPVPTNPKVGETYILEPGQYPGEDGKQGGKYRVVKEGNKIVLRRVQ